MAGTLAAYLGLIWAVVGLFGAAKWVRRKLFGIRCPHCGKKDFPVWDHTYAGRPRTNVAYNAKRCPTCRAVIEEQIGYTCPNCQAHEFPVWDHANGDGSQDRRYSENKKRCPRCRAVAAKASPRQTVSVAQQSAVAATIANAPPVYPTTLYISPAYTNRAEPTQPVLTQAPPKEASEPKLGAKAAAPSPASTQASQSMPPTSERAPKPAPPMVASPPRVPGSISDLNATTRRAVQETDIALTHKLMQREIQNCLQQASDWRRVYIEHSEIDIFVQDLDHQGFLVRETLIEIKTASNAKEAIRQAIGQLLEYRYYKQALIRTKEPCLVAVSPHPADSDCIAYLDSLHRSYGLVLKYIQYIPGSNQFSLPA